VIRNPVVEKNGVWFLRDHHQFPYNEGNRAEQYVLDVVRNARDVSSDSRELESHIKDWSSRYHLSRERSLAYRSLDIGPATRILEVGCGCGSITRLLGERSASVLALEGSPRRAEITRARVRDLQSVKVVCGSFEDVQFADQFDLVVCNGVFEYASVFVKHAAPHRHMLNQLAALVAPRGSLVVAIENKLGLRYFSSGKEEHTNVMFDGIEGYPRRPGGARTFGASELRRMLGETFRSVEGLVPLPDYKLPTALVRTQLLERVNCAELYANTARHDFGSRVVPRMHERLAWHELQRSGLLAEFSNSLFLIAGDQPSSLLGADWLGDIYSIRRRPGFAMRTRVTLAPDGTVSTSKTPLDGREHCADASRVLHVAVGSHWSDGESVHTLVTRAMMRGGTLALRDRLREPVLLWWSVVAGNETGRGSLAGRALDLNWQNILVKSGEPVAIDQEWIWPDDIDPAWLIFRVVSKFISEETPYFQRWSKASRRMSAHRMMREVAALTGVQFNRSRLVAAMRSEIAFQHEVTGKRLSAARMYGQCLEPVRSRILRKAVAAGLSKVRAKVASKLG